MVVSKETRIKIGFVFHGDFVPAWYAETISDLNKQSDIDIYFLQFPALKQQAKLPFAYQCFSRFEEKWFKSDYDAQKIVSIKELAKNDSLIKIQSECGYSLHQDAQARIKQLGLDVIYTIAFNPSDSENISDASAFGLWYIHFGYGAYNNSQVPAFWEVMDNKPVIGSYLLMRKDNSDFILLESTTAIVPHSVKNSFNSVAWKSSSFLGHRMRTLVALSGSFLNQFQQKFLAAKRKKRVPGNLKMTFLFVKNLYAYIKHKCRLMTDKKRFTLLYTFDRFSFGNFSNIKFNKINLPDNTFFADPFVLTKEDKNYIFFEEYVNAKGKAHISLIEVDASGKVSSPQIVMDEPYHLSYPFVFEKDGEYYMIPDQSGNWVVGLYKAVKFPLKWELVMNIIDGIPLIDSTIVYKNGLWWLFANSLNHPFVSANDQLFLFYSKDLCSSNWKPHPLNPIVTHIGNSRPAGRIFEWEGKLYRPAQNNASHQYGYAMVLNEIVVLNEKEYVEKLVYQINPIELGLKATHNVDFSPSILVIDGITK